MKVYGLTISTPQGVNLDQPSHIRQCRAVVAAKSKAAAVAALNESGIWISMHHFNRMAAETGNEREIVAANQMPGRVYVTSLNRGMEFVLVREAPRRVGTRRRNRQGAGRQPSSTSSTSTPGRGSEG